MRAVGDANFLQNVLYVFFYGLVANPEFLSDLFVGHPIGQLNKHFGFARSQGNFDVRGPFRLPEQDMMRTEIVLHQGLYCNQRRTNFVVTGGAVP